MREIIIMCYILPIIHKPKIYIMETITVQSKTLNQNQLTEAMDLLKLISHPINVRILKYINDKVETTVKPIYMDLRMEQSVTSKFLGELRKAGFVLSRKDGRKQIYSINTPRINKTMDSIADYFSS